VMKTRYAKPFEGVQVKIPYSTGMDPYSGLIDLFEKKGLLVKDGNRLRYDHSDGTEYKEYRRAWTGEKLDMIIEDMPNIVTKVNIANEPEEILLDERTTDN